MKDVQLGQYKINEQSPPLIIAEIADNHCGSLELAKQLIREAKISGAHFAKFQYHIPDIEMIPGSVSMWAGDLYKILNSNLLSHEDHREIKNYCEGIGITYLCTPFSIEASDKLEDLGVEFYKIGSGEMQNLHLLRHIAKKGKTMIVSTGMSTLDEIAEAVDMIKLEGCPFVLLYCVSAYPPDYSEINLELLDVYKEKFVCHVGLSDHTPTIWTSVASVSLGAKIIEKHFTLNKDLPGPDHAISLDRLQLSELCSATHAIWRSLGKDKNVSSDEQVIRDWAYHSLVAKRDLSEGLILGKHDICVKRPGIGIPAKRYEDFLGKKLIKSVKKDTLLHEDFFE